MAVFFFKVSDSLLYADCISSLDLVFSFNLSVTVSLLDGGVGDGVTSATFAH